MNIFFLISQKHAKMCSHYTHAVLAHVFRHCPIGTAIIFTPIVVIGIWAVNGTYQTKRDGVERQE